MRREMRVVEMDGNRNGPFDRGLCTDLLKVSVFSIIDWDSSIGIWVIGLGNRDWDFGIGTDQSA